MRTADGTKFVRTCERCGYTFEDVARRRVCRVCAGRTTSGMLMPWNDVRDRWCELSGEDITTETVRAIASVAIRKIRLQIMDDPQLAKDLGESGLPFEDWVTEDRDE